MKDVTPNIDINKVDILDEKSTTFDIEISEYDATSAYLEIEEELDEKTVSYIEREIRGSYEYRQYINYLKNELDLTKCTLLPGISCDDGVSLEFHHYPLNLYEITEVIGKKLISTLGDDEKVSCFQIAELVMEEHFRGNIGLVPLTKSLHEMAHNRTIIVPISKVEGNYKKFIDRYNSYIADDIKDRVRDAEISSESDDAKLYNQLKLEKNISKFDITYFNKEDSDEE